MSHHEHFECFTCYHTGPLDVHGACVECGSQEVMSAEVLDVIQRYAKGQVLVFDARL